MVLIVQQVRALVVEILGRAGYEVVEAENGAHGLKIYRARPTDLVLTDLIMPGDKSGVDLAREAVALRSDLPVILSSGYTGDVLSAVDDTPWPLLRKPYGAEQLARVIAEVTVQA